MALPDLEFSSEGATPPDRQWCSTLDSMTWQCARNVSWALPREFQQQLGHRLPLGASILADALKVRRV